MLSSHPDNQIIFYCQLPKTGIYKEVLSAGDFSNCTNIRWDGTYH